jgi:hypothetical protein
MGAAFVFGIAFFLGWIATIFYRLFGGVTPKDMLANKCIRLIKKLDSRVKKMQNLSFLPDTFRTTKLKPAAEELNQLLALDFSKKSKAELELFIKKLATIGDHIERLEKKALDYA